MAKNKFSNFAQLASVTTPTKAADLETPVTPTETIQQIDSVTTDGDAIIVNTVDTQGEDLGDVSVPATEARGATVPIVQVDELGYLATTPSEELSPFEESVEDERAHEDSAPGLNDETEEEPDGTAITDESTLTPFVPPPLTLNDRDVQTWTTDELEAYITGNVTEDVYFSTVKSAINEHRIRVDRLSNAWTIEECKAFLESGIVPAKTSKGAWVKDETRKHRREHEWSTQELESWALGEIQPEGVTLPAGLALELKDRLALNVPSQDVQAILTNYKHRTGQVNKPTANPAPTAVAAFVTESQKASVAKQITYEGLTEMNQSYIESSLAAFAAAMKPGKAVSPAFGGEAQKLLMQIINYAIRLEDPAASRSAMNLLLDYFRANRSHGQLFEDTYAFRFIEDMRATAKEQESHAALLTLFLVYADPLTELRAQTDTGSLIKGVPTQYQSRLFEFFSKL
jgi:hypothetical protein